MKYVAILFLFISGSLASQDTDSYFNLADKFFNTYVENGLVKYAEIKKNPKSLNDLMAQAKNINIPPSNEAQFKAFWINAYNLAVIDGIVKSYPVKSPMDIKGFFDQKTYSLGQKSLTLDQIEKKMLLGNFPDEERFHFVLVCAAKSCPPIISKAYRPETLEAQLQQQTVKALNDPNFLKLTRDKVEFSEMMKWYKEDFTKGNVTLIDYVNKFRTKKIPEGIASGYYTYNWELNEF